MKTRTTLRRNGWLAATLLAVGGLGAAAALLPTNFWSASGPSLPEGIRRAPVVRANLDVSLSAIGEVDSAENTLIECDLEEVSERSAGGQRISTSGRSMILELVPEGTMVEQGDVLCEIDGSEYEEMIRQKLIENEQARSELQEAELDLQTAEIALTEFLEGTRVQTIQEYEGQIALAEANYSRQKDRVDWAEQMLPLGYISSARYEQERQLLLSTRIDRDRAVDTLASYERYTVPKLTQTLQTEVDQRLSTATYMRRRLKRKEDQLASYEQQLANCTVRAPHGGRVIFATDDDDPPLAVGVLVHEHMDLFQLPNLDKMEVVVPLNETVVDRVAAGMPAEVRVVAFPDRILEGEVVEVEQLPMTTRISWIKDDVKQYRAIIEIESTPGLLPKMEAEVEILAARRSDALVVPTEAVAFDETTPYCYVAHDGRLEWRAVEVEPGSVNMLRVTSGLAEGEEVVLNPMDLDLAGIAVDRPKGPVVTNDADLAGNARVAAASPLLQ